MLGLIVLLTLHTSHVRARAFRFGVAIVLIIELSTFVQAIIGREGNDGTGYLMFVLVLIAPLVILSRIMRHDSRQHGDDPRRALRLRAARHRVRRDLRRASTTSSALGFFAQPGPKTNVDFLYFSFITQTTVGYGDLTPGTDVGRVVVTFEALIGQVFLVTLVARLVSMYGTRRGRDASTRADES